MTPASLAGASVRSMANTSPDDEQATELSTFEAPRLAADVYTLTVKTGPSAGASLTVTPETPRALIGQSSVCALRLEGSLVSRRHAAVESTSLGLRLTDQSSTNGVFIRGLRVLEAVLTGGEVVEIGGSTIEVTRDTDVPVTPEPPRASGFGRVVGKSPVMRSLYRLVEKLARANVSVLIEGETGTGKEVLAEALHEASGRSRGPFVVFDCTAVPPNLVESELLGHERGAFTGAVTSRPGVFEQAHGGTLLIDEIGDLDLALQPKLLRALERGEVKRVGGSRVSKVDVRILAATRRDLDREVQNGRFRDDLFHRLAVARVELPPLRQRKGDVPLLVAHFASQLGGDASAIPYEQMLRWESHGWPGNVRELRNAIARFVALGAEGEADFARSPSPMGQGRFDELLDLPIGIARQKLIDDFERVYVERVLARHGGDIEQAAASSGIARRQFFRLKAKMGG
jgi:two-component system, NtrC family, response regulator HydG